MEFAEGTVEVADEIVEAVAGFVEGEIPGSGVENGLTTEGFFEICEAEPGVVGVFGSGDAPEIEGVTAGGFSIENHLDEEDGSGGEFAIFVAGGSVGIEAGTFVIVDERGSERDGGFRSVDVS